MPSSFYERRTDKTVLKWKVSKWRKKNKRVSGRAMIEILYEEEDRWSLTQFVFFTLSSS